MGTSFSIVAAPMPLVAPANTKTFPLVRLSPKAELAATISLVETILLVVGGLRMKLFGKVELAGRGR
jgi:hypothetical protein